MDVKKSIKRLLFEGRFRRTKIFLIDAACFALVDLVYYFLAGRADYGTPVDNGIAYLTNSIILFFTLFGARMVMRLYNNVWRYTNTRAYFTMIIADAIGAICAVVISRIAGIVNSSYYIGIWFSVTVSSLTALISLFSRFSYRLVYKRVHGADKQTSVDKPRIPIAIVGAGQLGVYLAGELVGSPNSHYQPTCFIDKDKQKVGKRVVGLPVLSPDMAAIAMEKYGFGEVVIAIVGRDSNKTEELWRRYTELGCKVKVYDAPLNDGGNDDEEKKKRVIRDFSIEDILFRKAIDVSSTAELAYYEGKTVLVTGGGGSIGSELCRQLAKCKLKKLIILDIYENNAYDIQQELVRKYGDALDLSVEIGSVRDSVRLEAVFKNYRPEVVFHAAAHKHVPLMEHSGAEAIKNNVMGTYNTANMAEKYGAERFILISTDKAVNPTNVMGASKRICEMIVQSRCESKTSFAAVRFGNVLGSNGSVVPLFKRQIAAGGPVTITDKRIIRYFMTIPEASQLVILAGAKARRGELFVLDMGKPVKIYDLAVNMIKLMGYTPERDIEIKEIGLRPGEKLYEELLMKTETLVETDNKLIFVERDTPYSREEIEEKLEILRSAVVASQEEIGSDRIKEAIKKTVPTFIDPEQVNERAEQSSEMKQVEPATV